MTNETKKQMPANLSKEVLDRLEKIKGHNSPFVNGIADFNYTLGVPLVAGGFAFIFFDRLPTWFADDDVMKHFKRFFQANFRSFNGHSDITSQPITYIAGAVGYQVPLPGDVAAPTSEFTTTYLEYTGSPGKGMIERWFNAMHDVNTGQSLLGDMGISYGDPMNWTADVLYFEVRKDFKRKTIDTIEFATYWRGVFPTNIPTMSDHNYMLGQQSGTAVEGNIQWAGVQDPSPLVKNYALEVLNEHILNAESPYYIKSLDSMGVDEDAKGSITEDDILHKIYGNKK